MRDLHQAREVAAKLGGKLSGELLIRDWKPTKSRT